MFRKQSSRSFSTSDAREAHQQRSVLSLFDLTGYRLMHRADAVAPLRVKPSPVSSQFWSGHQFEDGLGDLQLLRPQVLALLARFSLLKVSAASSDDLPDSLGPRMATIFESRLMVVFAKRR
jgi:hypothetical protein